MTMWLAWDYTLEKAIKKNEVTDEEIKDNILMLARKYQNICIGESVSQRYLCSPAKKTTTLVVVDELAIEVNVIAEPKLICKTLFFFCSKSSKPIIFSVYK